MSINSAKAANELKHDMPNAVTDETAHEKVCPPVLQVTNFHLANQPP
jgi:hypothetical protein